MKKPIPKFIGYPKNGSMNIVNIGQWQRYLHTLDNIKCEIIVRRWRKKRSNPQNRYYFGVVCKIIGDHLGYTVDEAHSAIGWEFLRVEEEGKPPYVRSTTDLDTEEFNEFLEQVKIWAAKGFGDSEEKGGVYIPDPNEADY